MCQSKNKVKQSLYMPWEVLRLLGGWGSQLSRQSAYEFGKGVSTTHRPPLRPSKYFWYSFLLDAEWTIMRPEGLGLWKIPLTPSALLMSLTIITSIQKCHYWGGKTYWNLILKAVNGTKFESFRLSLNDTNERRRDFYDRSTSRHILYSHLATALFSCSSVSNEVKERDSYFYVCGTSINILLQ
jgi:hypothetical protein